MQFVRDLRISKKILLVALAFLLPVAVTGYSLARLELGIARDAQRAAHGVEMYQGIEELLSQVADHGGTLAAILNGDGTRRDKLSGIESLADKDAQELKSFNDLYGEEFHTRDDGQAVLNQWEGLRGRAASMTAAQSEASHSALLGHVIALNNAVADGSGLANYDDIAIAKVAEATRMVPELERSVAGVRSLAVAAAAAGSIDRATQMRLASLIEDDLQTWAQVQADLEAAAGYSDATKGAALKAAWGPVLGPFEASLESFHKLVRERILDAPRIAIHSGEVFDQGSAVYDKVGDLHDVLIPILAQELKDRVAFIHRVMTALAVVAGLLILFGVAFATWMTRAIDRSLGGVVEVFEHIEQGNYDSDIEVTSRDELGVVLGSLAKMQAGLKERRESDAAAAAEEARLAAENARVRVSLDRVSTSVMIADANGRIIYLNEAGQALLQQRAGDIRRQVPGFNPGAVIGSSFHDIDRATGQQSLVSGSSGTRQVDVAFGDACLRLVASVVSDSQGQQLGTVVQWFDRTSEAHTEEEVANVVQHALQGDLTVRLDESGKEGFFALLARGVNTLMDNTATLVRQVHQAAAEVARGAEEITRGNTYLSERTEQQASSLEETASSMEQMTASVKQNADNAAQANQLASQARAQAEQGGKVVQSAVGAMSEINTASRRIADIIGVIDDIAFQTNLLALNAAVEAARAGEQGRGFAVVAAEVRGLALRSAEAAKEIKSLIQDSVGKVNDGSRLVEASGETLVTIVTAVNHLTTIVAEIAAASAEQSSGIEGVTRAITSMDEITQQNAGLVGEAAAAAETLQTQSADLREMLARYRLSEGNAGGRDAAAAKGYELLDDALSAA
jgi:methyl-accepting chemotaxis protein